MRICLLLAIILATCTLSQSCLNTYDTIKQGMLFKMCLNVKAQSHSIQIDLQGQKYLGVYDLTIDDQSLVKWNLARYFTVLQLFQYIKQGDKVELFINGTIKIEFFSINKMITRYLFAVEKLSKEKILQMNVTIQSLKNTINNLRSQTSKQITAKTGFTFYDGFTAIVLAWIVIYLMHRENIHQMDKNQIYKNSFWNISTPFGNKFMIRDRVVIKTDRHMLTSSLPVPKLKLCQYNFKIVKYGNSFSSIRFGLTPKNRKNDKIQNKESIAYHSQKGNSSGQIIVNQFALLQRKEDLFIKEGGHLIIQVSMKTNKVVFKHLQTSAQQVKDQQKAREWEIDLPDNMKGEQLFIFTSLTNQSIIELVSVEEKQ